MKKALVFILSLVMIVSFTACGQSSAPAPAPAPAAEQTEEAAEPADTGETLKIAYLVSDMKETFHQASYEAAKEYAKEKYGAEVIAFDGAGDAANQIEMLDQFGAQGIDMATMHVWENDAAIPALKELLDAGVICASFFGPIPGSGIPAVRNDEAGVSKAMGAEMAQAWVAAHPDQKIVCVELGWPNHEQVRSGRTDPFIEGIKSVVGDDFTDLGCMESTGGADDAKASMAGILNSNPEVNLIYAESGGICKGVLSALQDAGRGTLNDDGTPKTELVCTCDFDETQFYQIYGNDSLIASLGLSPIETGRARIDYLFQIKNGEIPQISEPEAEYFCSATCISVGSMSKEDTAKWLQTECNVTPKMDGAEPAAAPAAEIEPGLRIAYLVSDMKETFHQASYEAAKEYAAEQYGAEVIAFDGAGDAANQIEMLDQFGAQGIDMATMHVWENDAAIPALKELLEEGVTCASFFGPIPGSGIPAVRNDEAAVSKAMGAEMAQAWVAAHPGEKIVCVELGWPNHEQVRSGRTDPFIEGIKSVVGDDFTDLGCMESTGGADDAKASMAGILNSNPEVNLIYAESGGICKGVLSALQDAGRGTLNDDGTPKTELVCTCDFDETQFYQIYGNDSLIASLGLSPIETGRARIDYLVKIRTGEIPQISEPEAEYFCSATCISVGSMSKEDTAKWLQTECNVTPKMD